MKKINWKNTIIRGEVKSDDCVKQAIFNAIPWFEQAADDDICALAACDFGGDYPADDKILLFSINLARYHKA